MSQDTIEPAGAAAPEHTHEPVPPDTQDDAAAPASVPVETASPRKGLTGEAKLCIGIMIGAALVAGITFWPNIRGSNRPPAPPPPAPVPVNRTTLVPPGAHIEGDPKAPFSLVEFGDFQCSHCAKARADTTAALAAHRGQLNIVFRHYRAVPTHKLSPTLAEGAEAAGMQGRFYDMLDKIFAYEEHWDAMDDDGARAQLVGFAKDLHLNVTRFKKDLDGQATAQAFERDQDAGDKLAIMGTPMFFFVPPKGDAVSLTTREYMMKWLGDPKHWK